MGRTARSIRGFLAHDERISLDNLAPNDGTVTGSSYTQADPKPGSPVPADARGTLLVYPSNGQDADLDVRVVSPGKPGIDGVGVLYREDGEADESYRGWCEPVLVTAYVPLAVSTTEDWLVADVATIPSSQVLVAVAADALGGSPVTTWARDPSTRIWAAGVVPDSNNLRGLCAIVCLRSDERLVVFQSAPVSGSLFAHYSDDAGTTWAEYSEPLQAGILDPSVDRIRVVEDAFGALLLLATDGSTGNWWLFRSDDFGMTFTATDNGAAWGTNPSMALLPNGRLVVVYQEWSTNDAKSIVLEDAYDTITGTTGLAIDGTNNVSNVEVVTDPDGVVYAVLRVAASAKWKLARSVDNAASWAVYRHNPMGVASATTPSDHLAQLAGLASSGGELVALFTPNNATSPATDGSLLSVVLGGWSSMEQSDGLGVRTDRFSFADDLGTAGDSSVYIPGEIFTNFGWTGAVGTAETRAGGYHRFNPTADVCASSLTTVYPTGGIQTILIEIRIVSGGSTTTDECRYKHTRNDGTHSRAVNLRCSTTHFAVWDDVSGTQIGSTISADMTALMQFLIVYPTSTSVSVFYKRPADTIWQLAAQKLTMGTGATGATTTVHGVGCAAVTTSDMRVGLLAWGAHALLRGLALDAFNINRLRWGKSLGTRPYPVRDQGGSLPTHLAASGGPGRMAEQIDLDAAYDHGVAEVLPQESPSPAARWRSTSTAEQSIAWDLQTDTRLGQSWAIGLCLAGANFSTAYLEVQADGAGAWTTIGTWSSAVATGVRYQREGDLLTPDATGGSASSFWAAGRLAGGLVSLDAGAKLRRIRTNSAGGWGPGNPLQPGILLDGIDGSEGSSGTLAVAAPAGVLVVTERTAPFRYIRIRIPTQNVAEGYFELGQVILGSLYVPGRQWSRGWSWVENQQLDLEEDDRGTLWAGQQRRPRRRELSVSWQDGYDATQFRAGLAPPYLSASPGSPPLVADQDVWQALSGMLLAAQGGALPVVALAEVPQSSGMVLDPTMFLAGMLSGRLQANNVQGDEGRSEVYRVESLTVVELV